MVVPTAGTCGAGLLFPLLLLLSSFLTRAAFASLTAFSAAFTSASVASLFSRTFLASASAAFSLPALSAV